MTRPANQHDRPCRKKRMDRIRALFVVGDARRRGGNRRELAAYKCHCGWWHTTSMPQAAALPGRETER